MVVNASLKYKNASSDFCWMSTCNSSTISMRSPELQSSGIGTAWPHTLGQFKPLGFLLPCPGLWIFKLSPVCTKVYHSLEPHTKFASVDHCHNSVHRLHRQIEDFVAAFRTCLRNHFWDRIMLKIGMHIVAALARWVS